MELSRAISLVAVVLIIVVAAGYAAADDDSEIKQEQAGISSR
jgi:hypothetical protein